MLRKRGRDTFEYDLCTVPNALRQMAAAFDRETHLWGGLVRHGKHQNMRLIFSRMLKKSQLALPVETKARLHVSAYARNRYPAKFDVQLPVTGRARPSEDHPLRPIRLMVDDALKALSPAFSRTFYSAFGRPSVFRQRSCCEHCFFAGVVYGSQRTNVDGATGIQPALSMVCWPEHGRNRVECRRCSARIGTGFWKGISPRSSSLHVLAQARLANLLSDEHFSVDGTLIEAWASQKSFQRKDRPAPPASRCQSRQSDDKTSAAKRAAMRRTSQ